MKSCPCCGAFPVIEWLEGKGVRLRPAPAYVLRHVFENPGRYHDWSDVLEDLGLSGSSTRFWMRKKSLPAPSQWLVLVRALHAARALHERRDTPVVRIAWDLGFGDHSAVTHLLNRAFGINSTAIRALPEFDVGELMELWWSRRARLPRTVTSNP